VNPIEPRTLPELLRGTVDRWGDRPAVAWVGGEPVPYREFGRRVEALSAGLASLGVSAGDRVAILSENRPEWGIAHFAVTSLGAVAVPILPDFHSDEIRTILAHAEARALIVSQRMFAKGEPDGGYPCPVRIRMEGFVPIPEGTSAAALADLPESGGLDRAPVSPDGAAARRPAREDDLAAIIYTSGTTGRSKGVMLSHRNFVFDTMNTLKIQRVTEQDRFLSILPLSHCYEFTIGFLIPLARGACVYYLDKPPVARVLMPALEAVRPTVMLTVPLIMEKVYKNSVLPKLTSNALTRGLMKFSPTRRLLHRAAARKVYRTFGGKLHFFGIGGAKVASDTERFLRDGRFPYAIGYGLTETSPMIAGCTPRLTRFRSTGPVIPDVEIRLENRDPQTGQGEIFVRGANVMAGYYRDPEKTREVLSPDGWFRTGDLGRLDRDGYLYIMGRAKNTIVGPNGENIYPEEIESVMNRLDEVTESLVYEHEGKVVARVHPNYEFLHRELEALNLTKDQISHAVRERLEAIRHRVNANVSRFSRITRIIEQQEPFEKTPTQKIKRFLYTGKHHGGAKDGKQ
jgi:long-chain acyl-CoA synthetase